LLNAISNQTASTIESARLYQESQRWADELAALLSATAVVSSSLELEEVLAGVAQHLTRLMKVSGCMLLDGDRDDMRLEPRKVYAPAELRAEMHLEGTIDITRFPRMLDVIRTLETAQLHSAQLAADSPERRIMDTAGVKSALLLPMVAHDNFVGLAILLDTAGA